MRFLLSGNIAVAQTPATEQKPKKKQKKKRPFHWVNALSAKHKKLPGLKHGTFVSSSMKFPVGYCIYLPPKYHSPQKNKRRFPVVYWLHGGRPGNETRNLWLCNFVDKAIKKGVIPPTIYVFVNDGPVSHYNLPKRKHAMGEDVFIKELVPHIDKTYRTIANRNGRALEGFSQGGRGTARIMFKHPHLFCSAAAGGGGHATEKRISESGGFENQNLKFAKGYNTWDLARNYAKKQAPKLRILIFVGDKGFNYQNNLEYMKFLRTLNIPFEKIIVKGAAHSAMTIYKKRGQEIMRFHAASFQKQSQCEAVSDDCSTTTASKSVRRR